MSKIIQVPTTRTGVAFWRVNVDHIVLYDGDWIYLNCDKGRISQTISSEELDALINNAQAGSAELIPQIQVPKL
jgi:hypothetical protein